MKKLDTLVEDIYQLFDNHNIPELQDTEVKELGERMASHIRDAILEPEKQPKLWASNIGTQCKRKLWYKINRFQDLEPLRPNTKLVFLFGHLLEELVLFLARIAGHKVEREQERIEYEGVSGRIDAVVDDVVCDVKSASSFSFRKFKDGLVASNDPFGYLRQLGFYKSLVDPDGEEAAFIAIDKQHGHITVDQHRQLGDVDYDKEIREVKTALANDTPPPRGYTDIPDGKSGNRRLDTVCSYCEAKFLCWPGLRTFYYSNGPKFLTEVKREPKVSEWEESNV